MRTLISDIRKTFAFYRAMRKATKAQREAWEDTPQHAKLNDLKLKRVHYQETPNNLAMKEYGRRLAAERDRIVIEAIREASKR